MNHAQRLCPVVCLADLAILDSVVYAGLAFVAVCDLELHCASVVGLHVPDSVAARLDHAADNDNAVSEVFAVAPVVGDICPLNTAAGT